MKKIVLSLVIVGLSIASSFSQSVRDARLSVMDADRLAYSIEFPYEYKVVDDAWKKKTEDLKIKSKNVKGIDTYSGVTVVDIHFEAVDLYVKIEKVDKSRTTFVITASKGYGNFISMDQHTDISDKLKSFCTAFITYTEQYKLSLDIKEQEDKIAKALKEQEKLLDEAKKLQDQIEKNKTDQANKVKELEDMKKILEGLKGKVKK